MEERPLVGIATILINEENKILFGYRINSHGDESWAFPGGHLERFESFLNGAKRELSEETGLVKINYLEEIPKVFTRDYFYKEKKDYVTFYLRAKLLEGKPKRLEKNKCLQWEFFDWKKLPKPLFLPIQNLIKHGYNPFDK